jgi:hypothetical protein
LGLGRHFFTGVVAAYVLTALTVGGTSRAWAVFYGLATAWCAFLAVRFLWYSRPLSPARWLRMLDLLASNLAFTLVLAELTLRGYAALTGASLLLNDTLDAYRLAPDRDYGGGLRGNRLGYPGREFVAEKRLGVFRVAALGDSFAVGPAAPFADNYLSLLERELPHTEVYNFGVSGTGPREYLAILRRDVWTYRPDLVLVSVFVGNDITEWMATPRHLDPRHFALCLFATRTGRLIREQRRMEPSHAEAPAAERLAPGLSDESFREVEARRLAVCLNPAPPALERKWRRTLGYLDQIITDCRQHQVPVAVVLIPDEFQVNPAVLAEALPQAYLDRNALDLTGPQRRLVEFCARRGVPCLDLLPAFAAVEDTYAPRDTHWNIRGNRLAASCLADWLPGALTSPAVSWRR